ncbi:Clan S-, family S54, Rhomboid-like serine peptidase [Trichomonas vaginalis G3]|uniref:Clan S-, family S54, Rhomboid-like serine peptidase n=1 Tax=Trichomonas vaginalis (strain ATCC PRA-98 / G3) TaxID=412133 RepID=A2DAB8_TRIV3|nr:serine-type endopeptidase protein [Trichomonas vaginalis G3]EAY22766.1 Clan S-, family S54, Rhomboid-like serine peptidase [Trichomonas vaginalis G3]KAI5525577.1 serine-type endopeptidase protein [Trichomonas vaginalis G3]|eukprot:XP_001583752.1 Clan S-, family S54, Rhomboid-like serine peptidase [Trichomonas vaginalis G3]
MLAWLDELPFGTKYLLIFMILLHIAKITLMPPLFMQKLYLNPFLVIKQNEYWRIFTSQYVHADIIHLAMNMMTFYQLGNFFERSVGTIAFFYYIFIFGVLSNLLDCLIAWFMAWGGRPEHFIGSAVGFSGVLFSLTVIDSAVSPGSQRSVMGLFLVPKDFYPWALLLFMSIIIPSASLLGHATGMVMGYLYIFGLLKWLVPSKETFSKIERKLCCCALNHNGYYAAENNGANQYQPYALFNNLAGNTENDDAAADDPENPHMLRPNARPNNNNRNNNDNIFHGTAHTIE